ncbi:MAG: ATP-binding protein [Solirubrobacteraceae bacterium]|nr:ATP-binding protein [Solirubrobacteraceae bacterium]
MSRGPIPKGDTTQTLLDRLHLTNVRAIELTEALLRLADANAVTARSEPVDLAVVADEALLALRDEADRRPVTIDARLEAASTVGDHTLLTQLTANLIQNAIRHNHAGGEVRLRTHADAATSRVTLRVENTGPTYTAALATQLVEPFLRGAGRLAAGEGPRSHGLGLALVAQIVAVHDARLSIVPRAGGGLVVSVEFASGAPGLAHS